MKKNNQKCFQIMLHTILFLLAGIFLGALLLTLAYCIPVNMGSYYSSELSLELQGWYPNVPNITNTFNTYFQTYLPGVLDNATVRNYIMPMTWATGENPLHTAMYCNGYSYYWHGYVIITRILQLFMNYEQIQMTSSFLQIAIIVMLAVVIGQKRGMKYTLMLISSYALMMPMAVAVCLQYYPAFYIAFVACLILIAKQEWFEQDSRLYYFFLVIGMLTSYFDLLTFPLITWGLPMVWWIATAREENRCFRAMKQIVSLGVAWIVGYGGMWFGKWGLATIVLQENIILEALKEVILRAGVDDMVAFAQTNRFYAVYMNWMHYTYKPYVLILAAWLFYWLFYGFLFGWKKISSAKCFSYLLVGASSIVWYLVLLNHTEIHHAFTYRIFSISLAAFFAIVLESTDGARGKFSMKRSVCFGFSGIALVIAAAGLSLLAKEVTPANNKDSQFETRLVANEELRIRFVPEYSRIVALGIGFDTKSSTGQYELVLYDGDTALYTEYIPVSHYEKGNYKDYIVDWHLTAGKEYLLTVKAQDMDQEVYAYYTADDALPLAGCQYYEGDTLTDSQPLLGIQYWCRPTSSKTLVLLAISYWAFLWVISYGAFCFKNEHKQNNV